MELCKSLHCPAKPTDRIWHRLKTVSGAEETLCNKLQLHHIPCYYPRTRIRSKTEIDSSSSKYKKHYQRFVLHFDETTMKNKFLSFSLL